MSLKSVAIALLIAVISFGTPAQSLGQAATPSPETQPRPSFAIQQAVQGEQPYFTVTVEAGDVGTAVAVVRTVNSIPLALRAYAVNAHNDINGGFDAGSEDEELAAPASWIDFPAQAFDLGETDEREIEFSVTVPIDARPGQYVAALIAQTDGPLPIEGTTALNQVIRSAIAVVITVPGDPEPSFNLGAPVLTTSTAGARLEIPIENDGTTLLRPEGRLSLTTLDGDLVSDVAVSMNTLYPFNATLISSALPQQFAYGEYIVSGRLTDPESGFSVEIEETVVTYEPAAEAPPPAEFAANPVTISPVGEPIQFADISITLVNNGNGIPTGKAILIVQRDGELVEEYALLQNVAMPSGESTVTQRYIPITGWEPGDYTFELEIWNVGSDGTETLIATVLIEEIISVAS
jgi:hypothetical protein